MDLEVNLEWADGEFTIDLETGSCDYPIPFLEKILDIWVAIIQENHSLIELTIDWEQEVCTARGLDTWVDPNKDKRKR